MSSSGLLSRLPWTVAESGWAYNGPFSTYKELHAGILGLAAGYLQQPELSASVVAWALGRSSRRTTRDAHWRQIAEEPAYALGSMTVGAAARRNELTVPLVTDVLTQVIA